MKEWILKYWLEALFGAALAGLTGAFARLRKGYQKKAKEQDALKEGMQALLRKSIIDDYNYYMEKGWIPIYAMENVVSMFHSYEGLDGNGTVPELVHELKELRHSDPNKHDKEDDQ